MTPSTPEDVSADILAELISLMGRTGHPIDAEVVAYLRELQSHRAENRTGYHANCPSCTCAFPSEEGR